MLQVSKLKHDSIRDNYHTHYPVFLVKIVLFFHPFIVVNYIPFLIRNE
jgi:hypothetical protein